MQTLSAVASGVKQSQQNRRPRPLAVASYRSGRSSWGGWRAPALIALPAGLTVEVIPSRLIYGPRPQLMVERGDARNTIFAQARVNWIIEHEQLPTAAIEGLGRSRMTTND